MLFFLTLDREEYAVSFLLPVALSCYYPVFKKLFSTTSAFYKAA